MIASLKGKLVYKSSNEIVLDVNGVGYQIFISKKVSEKLTSLNADYTIITYLDVKENSLQLFGFIDEKEKNIYKLLLTVSGIGPKIAHNILVHTTFEEIISLITNNSYLARVKIPGLGTKKLELISMSLKDKIYKMDKHLDLNQVDSLVPNESGEFKRFEALNALINLGYMRNEAEKIIHEVLKQSDSSENLTTEDIIRKSLEYISR